LALPYSAAIASQAPEPADRFDARSLNQAAGSPSGGPAASLCPARKDPGGPIIHVMDQSTAAASA